ncbi:MAG: metallophosphoesterase [Myxococcota bacterium]
MPSFRPLIFSLLVTVLLSLGIRSLLRRYFPAMSAHPWVASALKALPWLCAAAVVTWTAGNVMGLRGVSLIGASATGLLLMLMLPQLVALPLAAGVRRLLSGILLPAKSVSSSPAPIITAQTPEHVPQAPPAEPLRSSSTSSLPEHPMSTNVSSSSAGSEDSEASALLTTSAFSRRQFIRAATGAVPVAALTSSLSGVAMAAQPRAMPFVEMFYPDLPPELDGLRILHFSDVHLGVFVRVDDIERGLEQAAPHKPDLIVLTGDIADDLTQLEPALRLVSASKPRLGAFGAIGNHEYFRGFRETRQIYDRTDVPLLLEGGHTLQVGNSRLHLGGVNDPISLRKNSSEFMERTFDKTFDGAPSDAFHVALSHRPEGFIAASRRNIHLTLSGHTHGGQLGRNGRSLFEPLAEEKFLWGKYTRNQSHLYTSAGFGHWLPFRIGCPAEAPIIVLRRGTGTPV